MRVHEDHCSPRLSHRDQPSVHDDAGPQVLVRGRMSAIRWVPWALAWVTLLYPSPLPSAHQPPAKLLVLKLERGSLLFFRGHRVPPHLSSVVMT